MVTSVSVVTDAPAGIIAEKAKTGNGDFLTEQRYADW